MVGRPCSTHSKPSFEKVERQPRVNNPRPTGSSSCPEFCVNSGRARSALELRSSPDVFFRAGSNPRCELRRRRPQEGIANVAFEGRKAKRLRQPGRIDPVLYPPVKAARYQLDAPQGISVPRQGSGVDMLDLIIVRRDAPEEIGKLSGSATTPGSALRRDCPFRLWPSDMRSSADGSLPGLSALGGVPQSHHSRL